MNVFEITEYKEDITEGVRVYEMEGLYKSFCKVHNLVEDSDEAREMFDHNFIKFLGYHIDLSKVAIV